MCSRVHVRARVCMYVCMYVHIYVCACVYSFYILHIEFHVTRMYTKFWWRHPHHIKGSAGLVYTMEDYYFKYEQTSTLYYFLYFIFSWVVVIFRMWIKR